MMNDRCRIKLLTVIFTLQLCGCGTILKGERASFKLDSVPKGAKVTNYSGAVLGFTPIVLKLPRKAKGSDEKSVYVTIPGYKTAKVTITPDFNKKSLFNIAFIYTTTGLPSFTTDNSNGMLYQYQPGSYVVELKRIPSKQVFNEDPEEKARAKAEEILRAKAKRAEQDRIDEEEKAKAEVMLEAKQKAKTKSEQKAKAEAEQKAKAEAEQKAKAEAEQKAKAEAESKLEAERKRLANEKAKLEAEKAEIERLKLEAERLKIERERKKLEEEKRILQRSLEEAAEEVKKPIESPEERLRKQEEELLNKMKRRYQNQLKRKQQNRPKRDSRIPDIEVDPLSWADDSPSHGALALSIARYQVLLHDFALGKGESSQELYLRLCLALNESIDPQLLMKQYPLFMNIARSHSAVLSAPHGLALFRAIKPIHAQLLASH